MLGREIRWALRLPHEGRRDIESLHAHRASRAGRGEVTCLRSLCWVGLKWEPSPSCLDFNMLWRGWAREYLTLSFQLLSLGFFNKKGRGQRTGRKRNRRGERRELFCIYLRLLPKNQEVCILIPVLSSAHWDIMTLSRL